MHVAPLIGRNFVKIFLKLMNTVDSVVKIPRMWLLIGAWFPRRYERFHGISIFSCFTWFINGERSRRISEGCSGVSISMVYIVSIAGGPLSVFLGIFFSGTSFSAHFYTFGEIPQHLWFLWRYETAYITDINSHVRSSILIVIDFSDDPLNLVIKLKNVLWRFLSWISDSFWEWAFSGNFALINQLSTDIDLFI